MKSRTVTRGETEREREGERKRHNFKDTHTRHSLDYWRWKDKGCETRSDGVSLAHLHAHTLSTWYVIHPCDRGSVCCFVLSPVVLLRFILFICTVCYPGQWHEPQPSVFTHTLLESPVALTLSLSMGHFFSLLSSSRCVHVLCSHSPDAKGEAVNKKEKDLTHFREVNRHKFNCYCVCE